MGIAPDFEQTFDTYRELLHHETSRLATYVRIYRLLHERMVDRLEEINVAPAFFGLVLDSLFSSIVIWTDKLFDKRGERGFFDFLTYVEYNRAALTLSELKLRRQYPDGHWMLNRDEITLNTIIEHREKIGALEGLPSFALRRDKFQAHFDKGYFFNRERFAAEAPITWGDLDKTTELMWDILNTYSVAFDGRSYAGEPINASDVEHLLNALHAARKRKKKES